MSKLKKYLTEEEQLIMADGLKAVVAGLTPNSAVARVIAMKMLDHGIISQLHYHTIEVHGS